MNEVDWHSERRRHRRQKLELEFVLRTSRGLVPGQSQEIGEWGMSAVLPIELPEGEIVGLQIKLPTTTETIQAIVRNRNVFRHGFEFAHPLQGIVEDE